MVAKTSDQTVGSSSISAVRANTSLGKGNEADPIKPVRTAASSSKTNTTEPTIPRVTAVARGIGVVRTDVVISR
jgi:hypothetical protein